VQDGLANHWVEILGPGLGEVNEGIEVGADRSVGWRYIATTLTNTATGEQKSVLVLSPAKIYTRAVD